jgi:hypothetical protein
MREWTCNFLFLHNMHWQFQDYRRFNVNFNFISESWCHVDIGYIVDVSDLGNVDSRAYILSTLTLDSSIQYASWVELLLCIRILSSVFPSLCSVSIVRSHVDALFYWYTSDITLYITVIGHIKSRCICKTECLQVYAMCVNFSLVSSTFV